MNIVCHDMMGGYIEDNINNNLKNSKYCYRFNHWQLTDIFIYFSHNFISLPPKNYIDIAHRTDTLILATIITEGEQGYRLNKFLLEGKDNNLYYFADKLIDICHYYNFDGYLINIESDVDPSQIQQLILFVQYITNKIKINNPHKIIIFYDSVIITTGKV